MEMVGKKGYVQGQWYKDFNYLMWWFTADEGG